MKKVIFLFLILALCFSLVACFDTHTNSESEESETQSQKEPYTLEDLGEEYEDEILEHAETLAGDLEGTFEIVVLGKNKTKNQLENYIISENIDMGDIVSGLFVKFEVEDDNGEIITTIYYNYGLEFKDEQTKDVGFSFEGSDEVWLLEVVEKNKKLLFEYSIL